MKEIHIIEKTPLITPREPPIRAIHVLHPILLQITSKLIIIQKAPRQSTNDIDVVLVNALEHFSQEPLIVEGALEVVVLAGNGLGPFHEGVEAEFCY